MNKVILAVLVIVLLAGAGYVLTQNKTASTPTTASNTSSNEQASPSVVPSTMTESSNSATTTGAVKEITVESVGLKFTPNEIRVKKGDTVKLTYKNTKGNHDWNLDEFNAKTKVIGAGQSETIQFVADKTGTFEFYCSVDGHRQMGMKGKFIVE